MPRFTTQEYTLPASWASALINRDFSGLEDEPEQATACRQFLAELAAENICIEDVAPSFDGEAMEPYFVWNLAVAGVPSRGGLVLDYVGIEAA